MILPELRSLAYETLNTVDIRITNHLYNFLSVQVLADTVFVSQPTVSRVVDRVTDALCRQSDQYIRPCTQEEEVEVKRDFFNIAGRNNLFCFTYTGFMHA